MKKSGAKTSPQLGSHRFTRPPGYMKSTISADARRARPKVSKKRRSPRTSPDNSHRKDSTKSTNNCLIPRQEERALCGNLDIARATCSSTLKRSAYLEMNPGGTGLQGDSGLKVCPYSYCSCNGHLHAVLPPLKCFVSARRRALKAKRSIKLRCQSPKTREVPATSNGEEDQTHFFDEIYGDGVSQESYDEEGLSTGLLFTGDNWDSIGLSKSPPNEHVGNQASGPVEETTASADGTKCKAIKHDKSWVENECNRTENFNEAITKNLTNEPYLRNPELKSIEGECIVVHELNSRNVARPETEGKSFKGEKASQVCDDSKHFNLQLLQVEPEPDAEKVNLRHQEVDARKNAEEWMVDYALRQVVTKGSTASERKVALLVEAFERVLPTSKH